MRRLPLVVIPLTAACLIASAQAPSAGAATPAQASAGVQAKQPRDRFALGDSVMLGAKQDLKGLGFAGVDAVESRQAYLGPSLLRKRRSTLPVNVVVHLGTNGTFPLDVCKKMVRTAGPSRRVFLVTVKVPRSWQNGNNRVIHQCDAAFIADRVHVIDWKAAAAGHPTWFWGDRIHLRPSGARAFAQLINVSVDQAIAAARQNAVGSAGGSSSAGTHVR